jgi:zinc transporter, ZIP family
MHVLEAAWWGFVGGFALLVGAFMALYLHTSLRFVGLVMGFGTGVLFSAVAFDLAGEAYDRAGADAVVLGMLAGSLVFFAGDWVLDHRGANRRKSPTGMQDDATGMALVLGALLDGIPESAAIGVSLIGGGGVGVAVLVAVFLSNIPEGLSASVGMKASGKSTRYILGVWGAVALASTLAAALGYLVLGNSSAVVVATTQAFAAGAIITMLSDTMVPEAVKHAGSLVGLVTALGFVCAFLLSNA